MSNGLKMLMSVGVGFAAGAASVLLVLNLNGPAPDEKGGPSSRPAPAAGHSASFADAV